MPTAAEIVAELKALGNESAKKMYMKHGAKEPFYAVKIEDLKKIQKRVKRDHALALAGVGHRYPTVEIYSTAAANRPWEHSADALRGMSDMLHACHAATGPLVPTNEEWHYRPVGASVAMPWRINLKWRISTLAGFEGGTKINVNTIAPGMLREQMVAAMVPLRDAGTIAPLAVGDECSHRTGALNYLRG